MRQGLKTSYEQGDSRTLVLSSIRSLWAYEVPHPRPNRIKARAVKRRQGCPPRSARSFDLLRVNSILRSRGFSAQTAPSIRRGNVQHQRQESFPLHRRPNPLREKPSRSLTSSRALPRCQKKALSPGESLKCNSGSFCHNEGFWRKLC